eukprot:11980536-Ditylum_brightwellii.AAC.1
MYKIASKNQTRVLGFLGRLYSLIDLQKTDMNFIQEEIEDLKIKEPEEEEKIIELKRTASKMQDKFYILSTKINSATYMYGVAGGYATWNKLRRAKKHKITHGSHYWQTIQAVHV